MRGSDSFAAVTDSGDCSLSGTLFLGCFQCTKCSGSPCISGSQELWLQRCMCYRLLSLHISLLRPSWFLHSPQSWAVALLRNQYKLLGLPCLHQLLPLMQNLSHLGPSGALSHWPQCCSPAPTVSDNFYTHLVTLSRNRKIMGIKISLILFGVFLQRDWAKVYPVLSWKEN